MNSKKWGVLQLSKFRYVAIRTMSQPERYLLISEKTHKNESDALREMQEDKANWERAHSLYMKPKEQSL